MSIFMIIKILIKNWMTLFDWLIKIKKIGRPLLVDCISQCYDPILHDLIKKDTLRLAVFFHYDSSSSSDVIVTRGLTEIISTTYYKNPQINICSILHPQSMSINYFVTANLLHASIFQSICHSLMPEE